GARRERAAPARGDRARHDGRARPRADTARTAPRRRRDRPAARLTRPLPWGEMQILLSDRQRDVLRLVVEEYVASGQPVGSRTLVERSGLGVSPSTVRHELAELERFGLLMHPHTSAGRVPTESGYRVYVDE